MYTHTMECLNGAVTILVDKMGITMFYVILTMISIAILFICYEMFCSDIFQRTINSIIWFVQKFLGILFYQVFISEVKWFGIGNT